eukprot:967733-Pelagomonas_calceolata.AAC.1
MGVVTIVGITSSVRGQMCCVAGIVMGWLVFRDTGWAGRALFVLEGLIVGARRELGVLKRRRP